MKKLKSGINYTSFIIDDIERIRQKIWQKSRDLSAYISLSDSEVMARITIICLRIISKIFRKDYA